MKTWKWLKGELALVDYMIETGEAGRAFGRLGTLLLQYAELVDPQFDYHRASILQAMARAATALEETNLAEGFYLRALETLKTSPEVSPVEQADFNMSLAEHFAAQNLVTEAAFFNDAALETLIERPEAVCRDETVELFLSSTPRS